MEFPTLTLEYIEHLTIRVFQIKQALPYTREHLDEDGNYMFELYEEEIDILHVEMRPR